LAKPESSRSVDLKDLDMQPNRWLVPVTWIGIVVFPLITNAQDESDGQRLAAHSQRIVEALDSLGFPIEDNLKVELKTAQTNEDAASIQQVLDRVVVGVVSINPESRVKVEAGRGDARLQQAGYVPWLIKINNQAVVKSALRISSRQAGPSYAGVAILSMQRQDQLELRENEIKPDSARRFLHFVWHHQPPLAETLSGAKIEYAILLAYSSDMGKREATLEFSVGSGTQDLGFRAHLPLQLDAAPAIPVRLDIHDEDGKPTFAKLIIRDQLGNIYPPQPRRLAPDLFFQQQIYREHDESVLLPPGRFTVQFSQGPETIVQSQNLVVDGKSPNEWQFQLKRWVRPMEYGWYCGDHHIHGAGCAHYTSPTEGVTPKDMFRQIAGEGLNVGCILTWGPCFEYQRQFFRPSIDDVSRPKTLLKYDIEISGFGSQALGHVCLLNLHEQYYPGSDGTKEKGWPSWATPALKWAKDQGAVTGFAHSASGLQIDAVRASQRIFTQWDTDVSGLVSKTEAINALLPAPFESIDSDNDGGLSKTELQSAIDSAADRLPNLAIPEMNSVGAMELPVAVAEGVCDFISTMDTARIAEWNMWYHILNCGFPLKASGETDFPCMSGSAVGQGRVYVQLGKVEQLDFAAWCRALAEGKSYVSDGYAHALNCQASIGTKLATLGEQLKVDKPSQVNIRANISVASLMPKSVAYETRIPEGGRRFVGDTVTFHGSRSNEYVAPKERLVEFIVNGQVVASKNISCDGVEKQVEFTTAIDKSSWVAIRIFPHLHTNPIDVIVNDKPIRASAESARWCVAVIEQLWAQRERNISPDQRSEARRTFDKAIAEYRKRS
jgi:hypothetical protein